MATEHGPGWRSAGRPRPPWWVEAAGRDANDTQRDERAAERDEAGLARDETARKRDQAGIDREVDATDLVIAAHDRYDASDDADALALAEAEGLNRDERAVEQARVELLQANPKLAAALARMQDHAEAVYAALLDAGVQRDQARADLRSITQHMSAAAADRQADEQDRQDAEADRGAAHLDRDNARTGRQQAAIGRAPRSRDVDL